MSRLRGRIGVTVLVATIGFSSQKADAGLGDYPDPPPTEDDAEDAFGRTVVHYDAGGRIEHSTAVPGDSVFHTSGQGQGGGGVPVECKTFEWDEPQDNPHVGEVDPVTSLPQPATIEVPVTRTSFAWTYREMTPSGDWSPELQGHADYMDETPRFGLESGMTEGERYRGRTAPLVTATRRFSRGCGLPEGFVNGDRQFLSIDSFGDFEMGFVDVPLTDSFWNPLTRLGILWGRIQLPPFKVVPPPEVDTYGGLVVNMPTWLQIEADAWRPYFSDVDRYMGWESQLGLFPAELDFEVVGAGGGTVRCAPEESAARGGAIPGWPDELPRYYELGQLDEDCTWVPQDRGEVTIRARITYRVLLTISGYSEWLSPYVWYSDPLTLPVGELRIRNVTPEGGIGD